MATAADDGSTEGKVLDPNSLCGACESNPPVKFCQNCTVTLCTTCTRGHMKLHSTSHHCLVALDSEDEDNLSSGKSNSGYGKCRKHKDKDLKQYCGYCELLICTDCQPDHAGHSVQSFDDGWNTYERVCRTYMQSMLDSLRDLGEKRDFVDGHIKSYDDAIARVLEWEKKLRDLIAEYSQRLREELTSIKDEWENKLNDEASGLLKRFNEIDEELSRLHNTRQIKNCKRMSTELAKCQEMLATLDEYNDEYPDDLNVLSIGEILPNEDQISTIENDLACLLSTRYWTKDIRCGPVYNSMKLTGVKEPSIPSTECGFRMGLSNEHGNLILHGLWNSTDIRIVETKTCMETQYQSASIWNIISLSPNKYVAIGYGRDDIRLLDRGFQQISTTRAPPGTSVNGLCLISPLRFLVLKSRNVLPFQAKLLWNRISGTNITTENEMDVNVDDEIFYMDIDTNREKVVLCSYTKLYIVHIGEKKGVVRKHDISKHMDTATNNRVWGLRFDLAGNILVADELGKIHMYNKTLEHTVILKVDGGVRDMALKNGELIITTKDNKILFYS